VKPQVTGTGGKLAITSFSGVKPQHQPAKVDKKNDSPQDSFQSTPLTTDSGGDASHLSEDSPTPTNTASAKESQARSEVGTGAKSEPHSNAPLLLTSDMMVGSGAALTDRQPLLQIPEHQVIPQDTGPGTTLADLALAATRGIGRGLKRLIVGDELAVFRKELNSINELESKAQELKTPEQFAAKTAEFKDRLAAGETLEQMRPEVYAVAREAAKQETQMRAFDCQVIGALAMDDGHIAEMRTGEGKTLTAVLPLYLNALAGKGAHLVTVNETLAKRDSEWMGPIFQKLGMTVGCVTDTQSADEKRAGYNCDVTYVSDRALGFDFLRDRGAMDPSERVQRGHFFALIDEVDEVLIDEARTPMILSGRSGEPSEDYNLFGDIVKTLIPGDDFKLDEEKRTVWLTDGGLRYVENEVVIAEAKAKLATAAPNSEDAQMARKTVENGTLLRQAIRRENAAQKIFDDLDYEKPNAIARTLGFNGDYDQESAGKAEATLKVATTMREQLAGRVEGFNLYSEENDHRLPYLTTGLKAHTLFRRGKDYTVENGEVKIVDSNKGRVSEGKRYSEGIHQALEAKEGLTLKAETRTISKITMPELIAQYGRKSGMTGTGKTSEYEFLETYGLDVVQIPTNKPVIRTDHTDVVFASKEAKYQKVVEEAMTSARDGRPVLVGTVSVNANRDVAARLLNAGWPADRIQILNAETVRGGEDSHDPNAGRSGTITLTTGDRAKNVKHDPVNYKKMAFLAQSAVSLGKPVLIDAENQEDAEQVKAWLSGSVPVVLTQDSEPKAQEGVQIRVKSKGSEAKVPSAFAHINAQDHRVEKPLTFTVTENNLQDILPQALQAFADGEPVVLQAATTQQLGQTAENLLDHGLGLEAIPMVCDGKEKENVMIEMAGRSGIITVATNMAGRGANIKPDLVATTHISEAAYEKAMAGEAVTISVDKESQAIKIQRLLNDHVDVRVSRNPEQKPEPGKVLVRFGKELAEPNGGTHLKGSDFKTGGLQVIGTERSSSRRIDDQLIGRSGRQGAEGDSQFFLSLEDDIPRIFGGENFEPLLNLFGNSQEGVSSDLVNSVMNKAQSRVEGQYAEQRTNASKYQDVHKIQRETWYGMREGVLVGEDNAVDFVSSFGADGLASMVSEKLSSKRKHSPEELQKAIRQVSEELKVPLSYNGEKSLKTEEIAAALYPQVENLLKHPNLSEDKLRHVALRQIDGIWQDHLVAMTILQEGIHLESMGERKPEEAFVVRGFGAFEETIGYLKRQLAESILPAAAKLDKPASP
jgi:preprotein translocase subunit SecA